MSITEMDTGEQTPNNVIPIDADAVARFNKKVVERYESKRAEQEADRLFKEDEFADSFRPPVIYKNAAEGLAADRPPLEYGVESLAIKNSKVLITAQYKTGKTDFIQNLARCYADDTPFLGQFKVLPMDPGRTVVILDFELDDDYAWHLIKTQGIENTDRLNMICLNGVGWNLEVDKHYEWMRDALISLGCQILILDPFGAAYKGEENSNTEVRQWTDRLDELRRDCDIRETYLTTHTGRGVAEEGQERARGATRINDWASVFWNYTRDMKPGTTTPSNYRFLAANGRGVSVDEVTIAWEADNHHLTLVEGSGNRAQTRDASLATAIMAAVRDNPGITTNGVVKALKAAGVKKARAEVLESLDELGDPEDAGSILEFEKGPNNSKKWSVAPHALYLINKGKNPVTGEV